MIPLPCVQSNQRYIEKKNVTMANEKGNSRSKNVSVLAADIFRFVCCFCLAVYGIFNAEI